MNRYLHALHIHTFTPWREWQDWRDSNHTIYHRHCTICGKEERLDVLKSSCLLAPSSPLAWWLAALLLVGGGLLLACVYAIYKLTHKSP